MDTSAPAVQAPGRFGFSINRGKTLMPTVLDIATPHILRTEAEYEEAVAEVDRLLRVTRSSGPRSTIDWNCSES
jgi:hypothetical protein